MTSCSPSVELPVGSVYYNKMYYKNFKVVLKIAKNHIMIIPDRHITIKILMAISQYLALLV